MGCVAYLVTQGICKNMVYAITFIQVETGNYYQEPDGFAKYLFLSLEKRCPY
jgi:hypothetical protein